MAHLTMMHRVGEILRKRAVRGCAAETIRPLWLSSTKDLRFGAWIPSEGAAPLMRHGWGSACPTRYCHPSGLLLHL